MAEYSEYDWRKQMISDEIMKEMPRPKTNQKDKENALNGLKQLLDKSEDFELRKDLKRDDGTLTKFLAARKFDVDETCQLIHNYHRYRKKNPTLFEDYNIRAGDIRKSLENGLPGVLASKDRKGRCVLVLNATNWDCSYSLLGIYRALLLSLDHLVADVYVQSQGFVVIVDWTEFSFRQSVHLKPSILRLMIEGLQDCYPAKFKGVHFINQPWYVEAALAVIRPFLKEKMKRRIFVHGNNLSTLHDYVHKDVLPAEFGGEQPSYNPAKWLEILENNCE